MLLTCPHCGYCKEVAEGRIPETATRATCPGCQKKFELAQTALTGRQIKCPVCAIKQPQGDTCSACGLNLSQWQQTRNQPFKQVKDQVPEPAPDQIPKAGFWLRFFALMIDGMLVVALQSVLSLLLVFVGLSSTSFDLNMAGPMAQLVMLFTYVISATYYIFFTGYCGQTPGKMLVRIKVVRKDGEPVSFSRAAFRELPGKFVSAIIFWIGYLMAAFDKQKQALHDRIADTYVIKL